MAVSTPLVTAFAILHGHAHTSEMPATASAAAYALGCLAATALLLAVGVALATVVQRRQTPDTVRIAGGVIAAAGLFLCVLQF
jgi:urease accessory protein